MQHADVKPSQLEDIFHQPNFQFEIHLRRNAVAKKDLADFFENLITQKLYADAVRLIKSLPNADFFSYVYPKTAKTPLETALDEKEPNTELVREMFRAGAEHFLDDDHKKTLLVRMNEEKKSHLILESLAYFQEATINTLILRLVKENEFGLALKVLETMKSSIRISAKDKPTLNTAMHYVVHGIEIDLAKRLCIHVSMLESNRLGVSPLLAAVKTGCFNIAEMLVTNYKKACSPFEINEIILILIKQQPLPHQLTLMRAILEHVLTHLTLESLHKTIRYLFNNTEDLNKRLGFLKLFTNHSQHETDSVLTKKREYVTYLLTDQIKACDNVDVLKDLKTAIERIKPEIPFFSCKRKNGALHLNIQSECLGKIFTEIDKKIKEFNRLDTQAANAKKLTDSKTHVAFPQNNLSNLKEAAQILLWKSVAGGVGATLIPDAAPAGTNVKHNFSALDDSPVHKP